MMFKKYFLPFLTILLAIAVVIISFTSLVIPENVYKPLLFGMPYSLWMGILVSLLLLLLTWAATRFHPEAREAKKREQKVKPQK